jgi:AcrR family transcriptional regulator
MGESQTADKVFEIALRLFAEHGYDATSMRRIAAEAGIKAASIYNHYAGKTAILDEALRRFSSETERRITYLDEAGYTSELSALTPKTVLTRIMLAPVSLMENEETRLLAKVVIKGQFHHAGIRTWLRIGIFEKPGVALASFLKILVRRGEIESFPIPFMVAELQAPLVTEIYRRGLDPGERPFNIDGIRTAIETHVDFFWRAVRPTVATTRRED